MIRHLLPLLLTSSVFAQTEEPVAPPRDPAYTLVWSDEFDGDGAVDESKWHFEEGFQRNHELQWYQKDNAVKKNGLLVIEARREKVPNPRFRDGSRDWKQQRKEAEYTSASLTTAGKHDWTFGRFEIRARFTAAPGLWPAIWTTGRGRWPHGGEIDIMEYYGGRIYANFCWAGRGGRDLWSTGSHSFDRFDPAAWGERFHLWVMEWDKDRIVIWLDGQILNQQELKHVQNLDGPPVNPFLAPQAMRLNLAIGGMNGGDPSRTSFPQRYEVDFVRIYQKPE